jgi:mannose-6-phosphate isomerase-like protein (cupin superfamily)
MRCEILFTAAVLFVIAPLTVLTQNLDGNPYTPGVDADISFYLCNWRESQPVISHGSLIERNIFTRGDPLRPPARGKVLKYMNRFTYAELSSGSVTTPTKLSDEQELLYILSGKGVIKTAKTTADLYPGIAVLVPAGCEFSLSSTNPKNNLTLYLVNEPIPAGFRPNDDIKVKDVDASPILSNNVHWCHQWRGMFITNDGFGTIESTGTVTFDPMVIGHPHSHVEGCEEIWAAIEGDSFAFIGKQIFLQTPGMAFMIPPDGKTPHSTINTSNKQIRMLYIARYGDHEVRK